MFLLCCCGERYEPDPERSVQESLRENNEPVIIEPLPDAATLHLSNPNSLTEKSPDKSVAQNWDTFDDVTTTNFQVATAASPPQMFMPSSGEKHDMRKALDENISRKEYILGIRDEELANLPIVYIESFYTTLSPGDIMQLEQRLCDLPSRMPKNSRKGLVTEASLNYLKEMRPQFFIRTDFGFVIEDEPRNQNGLDIRRIILAANNEEIASLDPSEIKKLRSFLTVLEQEEIFGQTAFSYKKTAEPPFSLPKDQGKEAAFSYAAKLSPASSDMYYLTADPFLSTDKSMNFEDDIQHATAEAIRSEKPAVPLIEITNDDANDSPNEEAVKSLIGDVLQKL